jgi:hypothetical protein
MYEVHFAQDQRAPTVSITRDLWFERTDGQSWLVWAQERSSTGDDSLPDADTDIDALGSIVVTHPTVMAFLDQLGTLLVNPARFRHAARFAEDSATRPDDRTAPG